MLLLYLVKSSVCMCGYIMYYDEIILSNLEQS